MTNEYASREPHGPMPTRLDLSDVEFRGETIYFLVLDRFCRGNGAPLPGDKLSDPTHQDWHKFWGGNLQGLCDRIDYLQQLGISAVWVTPLFEQVDAPAYEGKAPIHGYWAQDFKRIGKQWVNEPCEQRLFAAEDTVFDRVISQLHQHGMKFVLDVVCNHSSPRTESGKGRLYDDGRLIADFDHDDEHWYHHYGEVTDWEDDWQLKNCELAGLATFNENNILFRRYIKDSLKQWIGKGVDAIRLDTVKHMPTWFWQELSSDLQSCRPDLFIMGEWIYSHPLQANSVDYANRAGMSLLDFGFCDAVRSALGHNEEKGFAHVQALLDDDDRYRSATELVTFFENHDMPRFQSLDARPERLHLALVLLLTSRGIPCLYYGCEQYLHNDTEGGNDPYNRPLMAQWDDTPACHIIRTLTRLRRENAAIRWGGQWPKVVESDRYAYVRRYLDSRCFVLLNRGGEGELHVADCELPDGEYRCDLTQRLVRVDGGEIQFQLQGNDTVVLSLPGEPLAGRSIAHVQLNGAPTSPPQRVAIIGEAAELGAWDIRNAVPLECVNTNTWFGQIAFDESIESDVAYKYVIVADDGSSSPLWENCMTRRRRVTAGRVVKWRDVWEE